MRATASPNSRDEIGRHFPASRCNSMRSRLRSTAVKKMSFSVAMLMRLSSPGPRASSHQRQRLRTELYCFAGAFSNAYGHRVGYCPVTQVCRQVGPGLCWDITPVGGVPMKKYSGVLAGLLLAGSLVTTAASPLFAQGGNAPEMPKVGDTAPDFTLHYFDGNDLKEMKLSDY